MNGLTQTQCYTSNPPPNPFPVSVLQVNSWPCSTPTLPSGRAASTSAATSSCSPQTSRWVTSASSTTLTWGTPSKSVHSTYYWEGKLYSSIKHTLHNPSLSLCCWCNEPFSTSGLCRRQPALPVHTLQRAQDHQRRVGASGRVRHRRSRERRDQPVQRQGGSHKGGDGEGGLTAFTWLNVEKPARSCRLTKWTRSLLLFVDRLVRSRRR